jgi:hypothetical protein
LLGSFPPLVGVSTLWGKSSTLVPKVGDGSIYVATSLGKH